MPNALTIGVAERVITPPVGTSLAGYFHDRKSTAVRDDLFAKAVAASDGDETVVLIACDLIAISDELSGQARELIEKRAGVPGSHVMVSATHTHTGPDVRGGRVVPRNDEWFAQAPGLVADAACEALDAQRPAALWVGRGREEGLAFNRRFRLPDGTEQFGTGGDPATVVAPAGPTDPELAVVKFADENGEPFGLLVNYTLHIDVMGGTEISADYPGVLTQVVRAVYGPETWCAFINGAAGNINHVDYSGRSPWPTKGPEKSRQIGRALGGHAVSVAEKAWPSTTMRVGAEQRRLELAYHPIDEFVKRYARRVHAKPEADRNWVEKEFLSSMERWEKSGQAVSVEVQVFRIGDVALVGTPGELFVEWGLEIKKWSPFPFTLVVEQANQSHGYLATWEALRRTGYEATPFVGTHLAPGAGQAIADAAFVMLRELADPLPGNRDGANVRPPVEWGGPT
jgi:neutral ceramidase